MKALKHINRLSFKLLFYILLCSSAFTLFGTAIQLYIDYRSDISDIERAFEQIQTSSLRPLAVSLWNFDRKQLQIQLEGLLSQPDMQYAEIKEISGSKEAIILSMGELSSRQTITRSFPLEYKGYNGKVLIGTLTITASLSKIYSRLRDKVLLVLVTQAIKTFFVSILILMVFQFLIMKHLNTIANHMRQLNLNRLGNPLRLQRKPSAADDPDLLDDVVSAINSMKSSLRKDIEAREATEKELLISEGKYRTLFESSPVSIWLLNLCDVEGLLKKEGLTSPEALDDRLDTDPGFITRAGNRVHVLDINQATLTIFKADSKQQLVDSYEKLFGRRGNHVFKPLLRAICAGDELIEMQFQANDVTGGILHLIVQLIMPHNPGEPGRNEAILCLTDVTHQKQIEEVLIQSEKLASIGNLAAGMAHEINNPLGAILQSSQNIKRRTSTSLRKNREVAGELGLEMDKIAAYMEVREINRFIDVILKSGKRAADIITNILQFSRRSESNIIETQLDLLMDEALELAMNDYNLKKKFDFKYITVETDYKKNISPVRVTESEIIQVFLNLLKNAAHALMDEGVIDNPRINLRIRQEGEWVVSEIEDNGPGMDENTRKSIFEPFFTTKPVGQGTGLGLSVSYMIITDNHRGTINVESNPGEGTRFIIRLPAGNPS